MKGARAMSDLVVVAFPSEEKAEEVGKNRWRCSRNT
jgi:hypothetical protein